MIFDYSTSRVLLVLLFTIVHKTENLSSTFLQIIFVHDYRDSLRLRLIFLFLFAKQVHNILTNGEILRYRNRHDRNKKLVLLLFHQLNTTNPYYISYLYRIFSLSLLPRMTKLLYTEKYIQNRKNSNFANGIFFLLVAAIIFHNNNHKNQNLFILIFKRVLNDKAMSFFASSSALVFLCDLKTRGKVSQDFNDSSHQHEMLIFDIKVSLEWIMDDKMITACMVEIIKMRGMQNGMER